MRVHESQPTPSQKPAEERSRFKEALEQAEARKAQDAHQKAPRAQEASPRRPGERPAPKPSASTAGTTKPSPSSSGAAGVKPTGGASPRLAASASGVRHVIASRTALASPENLGQVRQGLHAEAQRLSNTRAEAHTLSQERTEHRVNELLARELTRSFQAEPPAPRPGGTRPTVAADCEPARGTPGESAVQAAEARVAGAAGGVKPAEAPEAHLRAQAALELVERIEVFVKSQRPALKMSLGGALDASVEVERTGPREVALRIQGHRGPVPSEDLARIRDALEARGLRLRSLRAG